MVLDPWQVDALEVALGERDDGTWAAREVGLICPRQNGKGSVLEAVELAGLFLFGEQLILHSAHEFKTAADAFVRVRGLIEQTPDLARLVARIYSGHGNETIELTTGQRLKFVARSKGSGRGFSADRIVLDEAFNLSDKSVSALLFTMSARPNPQVWYTSSAPLATADSEVLRRLCRRGREGSPRLAYMEFAADPDCDLDDRDAWQAANPGYPYRIDPEAIEVERGAATPEDFARERLGVWIEDPNTADRVIPPDLWIACLHPTSTPEGRPAYALDVSPDGASAAVAMSDGSHVEIVAHRQGMTWLVEACVAKADAFDEIILDPAGPAAALVVPLENAGIKVRQVKLRESQQACGGFLEAVNNGTLRHIGQPELDAAVAGADRRNVSDAWLWSRRTSRVDICPLVAATLARQAGIEADTGEPDFYTL